MKRGYTLVELLIVVAVTATLLSVIGQFFSDGWVASHRAFRRVESNQLCLLAMSRWQKSLRNTSPRSWRTDGDVFEAGSVRMSSSASHITIRSNDCEKSMLLPQGATCKFSIERDSALASCAVLDISWESKFFRKIKENKVRYVACGSKE